jgi:hypothetical protein
MLATLSGEHASVYRAEHRVPSRPYSYCYSLLCERTSHSGNPALDRGSVAACISSCTSFSRDGELKTHSVVPADAVSLKPAGCFLFGSPASLILFVGTLARLVSLSFPFGLIRHGMSASESRRESSTRSSETVHCESPRHFQIQSSLLKNCAYIPSDILVDSRCRKGCLWTVESCPM